MVGIPITISTPGLHTHVATDLPEYPFVNSFEHPSSGLAIRPSMVSQSTQTDIEDFDISPLLGKHSPAHSRPTSPSRSPAHQGWVKQIRTRLRSPHSQHQDSTATDPSSGLLLAPPESDPPKRPATPSADLYRGQPEASFGMTFETHENACMRKAKPDPCAFKYEDQKHHMMMDWLERRGTW